MKILNYILTTQKPDISGFCRLSFFILFVISFSLLLACDKTDIPPINPDPNPDPDPIENGDSIPEVIILEESDVIDFDKFHKPAEHRNVDFLRSDSKWNFVNSKQSENFIVFWEQGFGSDPNASNVPEALRVDIDDLLIKAEEYFDVNVNLLKFANVGVGESNLDNYKMQIYMFYTQEWMAYGAGYDDLIGALWVNPSTCKPVGSTIAHEIGHSFQYQVFCDIQEGSGFRYGFGGNGGNSFWEQCAQWQAYQSYPDQAFNSHHFNVHMDNYFRHFHHEWHRYASYWLHYYWADKHGIDIVGRVWREAREPEDPIQAYMRITNIDTEQLNAELYEAATRFVTWDIDAIRNRGSNYIGRHTYKLYELSDGSYQVAYSHCPSTSGYNVIPLNVPEAGTVVSTTFSGLTPGSSLADADPGTYNDEGNTYSKRNYNGGSLTRAGWRYGYVALLDNGQRVYGEMNSRSEITVNFTVPQGCEKLWFVVLGAPSSYTAHPWDEKESNDDQWPYKVKIENTDLLGSISFDGDEEHSDVTLSYDIAFPASSDAYSGTTVSINNDLDKLAKAFVLQPSTISGLMDSKVKFYAVESNGQLNATTTANGYGHWFDANGDVIGWGENAMIFSEYDAAAFSFSIGQYPEHCSPGDEYTIKQALVYEYEPGQTVQATFVFNITIQ